MSAQLLKGITVQKGDEFFLYDNKEYRNKMTLEEFLHEYEILGAFIFNLTYPEFVEVFKERGIA